MRWEKEESVDEPETLAFVAPTTAAREIRVSYALRNIYTLLDSLLILRPFVWFTI